MTEDEMRALRLLIREETNAAVYASEERVVTYVRPLTQQIEGMQGVMERLNERMGRLEISVDRLETDQRDIKATLIRFEANLSETISVIDDVTNVINDLQASQRSLELKLEDNISGMRKELLRLNESIHTFARQFITLHMETNDRITLHERTHISETHPKPHSAA